MAKCAHPACSCEVAKGGLFGRGGPFGKYCSEHCRQMKDMAEMECECGHPACEEETKKAVDARS